jgi:hypothetical protein
LFTKAFSMLNFYCMAAVSLKLVSARCYHFFMKVYLALWLATHAVEAVANGGTA